MKYLSILLLISVLFGCGSDRGPDPQVEAQRVESATKMREVFLRVNGNYDQLTEAEKADFVKLFKGNEADAQKAWGFMKDQNVRPGAGPSQSGPTSGPSGS